MEKCWLSACPTPLSFCESAPAFRSAGGIWPRAVGMPVSTRALPARLPAVARMAGVLDDRRDCCLLHPGMLRDGVSPAVRVGILCGGCAGRDPQAQHPRHVVAPMALLGDRRLMGPHVGAFFRRNAEPDA